MTNLNPLSPTFRGYVASTFDALVLFEACLIGQLNHVPRRPHDRERQELITSGSIFIYEEHASGIKRWTDGVSWSPSRILNNFLVYRELERPFPPGEKKRALKKNKKPQGIVKSEVAVRPGATQLVDGSAVGRDMERALVGSLVDSYPFKNDGLVKKTISITFQGVPHHLVSYYNLSDVQAGRLMTPSKHPHCQSIVPRGELLMQQNFRSAIDEIEFDDRAATTSALYAMPLHVAGYQPVAPPSYAALPSYAFSQQDQHAQHQAGLQHVQHQHQAHAQHHPHPQQHQMHVQHQQHPHNPHHSQHQNGLQHQSPSQLHLSQHQLPQHQPPQHQPQAQAQAHPQSQAQPQHPQSQDQHQQNHQHQHQHHHQQHQHQPQHQHQHQQQHPHTHQHQYAVQSTYIPTTTPASFLTQVPYVGQTQESYAGNVWGFETLDRAQHYFAEGQQQHASDDSTWWSSDSNEVKREQGPNEATQ